MFKKLLITVFLLANTSIVFAENHIIYLTRHAEKQTTGNDPALTTQGKLRANNIAQTLERANITNIYSTSYTRTQQTAQPLANSLSLSVQNYDPNQLTTFANQLKTMTGSTLVVGHSNTTPELISLLGGDVVDPIAEDEFDRLYQVIISNNGQITTTLLSSLPRAVVQIDCSDVVVDLNSLSASNKAWYHTSMNVPECANSLNVIMSGGTGDADLYLRFGNAPTEQVFNCRPYENGNAESCTINSPQAGVWHIGLHAYQTFSGVSLHVTVKE
jgi:phosphohistidine phosphatase SixA